MVIQKQKRYDPALQESLVDLDIEIAQDERMKVISLNVLLLSNTCQEAIDTFVSYPVIQRSSCMPNREAHFTLAAHNKDTRDLLAPYTDKFIDWVATIAFFKAIHLVEALFFMLDGAHSYGHEDRIDRLKTHEYLHTKADSAFGGKASIDKSGRDLLAF